MSDNDPSVSLHPSLVSDGNGDLGEMVSVTRDGRQIGVARRCTFWRNERWTAEDAQGVNLGTYPDSDTACRALAEGRDLTPLQLEPSDRHRALLRECGWHDPVLARLRSTGELLVLPGALVRQWNAGDVAVGRPARFELVMTLRELHAQDARKRA